MSKLAEKPKLASIGERIRWMRENALDGNKSINLAGELKVTTGRVSQWENNINVPPPWRMRQLAEVFGCSLAYLQKGDRLPAESGRLNAITIANNLEERFRVAWGVADVTPRIVSLPQLSLVIEPLNTTLLDLEELDTSRDMVEALPIVETIIRWAELAWEEQIPGAELVLFEACDRAVRFKCFAALASSIIAEVTPYFGKMNQVAYLHKHLHAHVCGRWGDVYKISAAEKPKLAGAALRYFEAAYRGGGRSDGLSLDYPTFRSPAIVAGSLPIGHNEFQKHLARLESGLNLGRFPRRIEVHVVDGRSEAHAQRYKLTSSKEHKTAALRDMENAQRLAKTVGKKHGQHPELWLRTEQLAITLWMLGIRDHMSVAGMSDTAAVAQKASELLDHARQFGSNRVASRMRRVVQSVDKNRR